MRFRVIENFLNNEIEYYAILARIIGINMRYRRTAHDNYSNGRG